MAGRTYPIGKGWKIYFWLIAVLFAASLVIVAYQVGAMSDEASIASEVVRLALSGVGLVAVGGYVFGRRLLAAQFWKVSFWFVLGVVATLQWYPLFREVVRGPDPWMYVFVICGVLLLAGPQYVAHFRYGYRRSELWA